MLKKVAIIIAPNWKDYAEKYLSECIASIRKQDYQGEIKIFMADNESTDASYGYLNRRVPEAEVHRNKTNDGFAKGNNDAMRLALDQNFDYLFLVNMDTLVEADCVSELVKTLESDESIGAVQARLMLWPDKDRINSLGNVSHFLGFGYSLGYRKKFTNYKLQITNYIQYPSGAAVMFTRKALETAGLFDEAYWMYNEDQELGWRLWLAGFKCVLAPQAVVYHKYEFAKSIKQYYWMDRNRIITVLICYKLPTLLLLLPAFVIMELGLVLFSIKSGWFRGKLRVWSFFLKPKTWRYLTKARRHNQSLRKVKDREIIKMITGKIWYQEVDDWKLRLVNPVFNLYWQAIKRIIIW